MLVLFCSACLTVLASSMVTRAAEIRVAVASNFHGTLRDIADRYQQRSNHSVQLVSGSTGKHFAQIINGAPFDAFLAGDARHPRLLEEKGFAVPGTRFTYAEGKLVLWSAEPGYVDPSGRVLETAGFRHLALANPRLAPYGAAAREVLEKRGLWQNLQDRVVLGENIAQTFQFVVSGNARLGFIARSQLQRPAHPATGSWWDIPETLYSPILQQAVLLRDDAATRDFLAFLQTEEAHRIMQARGYERP
jgi:molybdate transport system substrate-binding protein